MRQLFSETPDVEDALALLEEAYRTRTTRAERTVEYPTGRPAARSDDQPPAVVIVGLLYDVLEDTELTAKGLRERFGPAGNAPARSDCSRTIRSWRRPSRRLSSQAEDRRQAG
jgi:hypothetical protein